MGACATRCRTSGRNNGNLTNPLLSNEKRTPAATKYLLEPLVFSSIFAPALPSIIAVSADKKIHNFTFGSARNVLENPCLTCAGVGRYSAISCGSGRLALKTSSPNDRSTQPSRARTDSERAWLWPNRFNVTSTLKYGSAPTQAGSTTATR